MQSLSDIRVARTVDLSEVECRAKYHAVPRFSGSISRVFDSDKPVAFVLSNRGC